MMEQRLAPLKLLVLVSIALVGAAGATEAAKSPVQISLFTARELLLHTVNPAYPVEARRAHVQGIVTLKLVTTKSGDVDRVELVNGNPMLAPPAIEAVKQWKYKPFLVDGKPVPVSTTEYLFFRLPKDSSNNGETANHDNPSATTPAATEPPEGTTGIVEGIIGGVIGKPPTPNSPPSQNPPERVRVSQGVSKGLLVKRIAPTYPPIAERAHIAGDVVLQINIDKEGNVYNAEPITGHPILVPAAIEAVKQRKYRPYLLNGQAVEMVTQANVTFSLQ